MNVSCLKNQSGGATLIVVAMTATIAVFVTSSVMNQINVVNQSGTMARDRLATLMVTPAIAQRVVTLKDRTPSGGGNCVTENGSPMVRRNINGTQLCVPVGNWASNLSCVDHPWAAGEQVCFELPSPGGGNGGGNGP